MHAQFIRLIFRYFAQRFTLLYQEFRVAAFVSSPSLVTNVNKDIHGVKKYIISTFKIKMQGAGKP